MKILELIRNPKGLLAKGIRGGAWLMMGSVAEHGLRFVRNMILTRLLAPESFGVMAQMMAISGLFQVLTSVGVREAVIQNPRSTEDTYLNGAWWLNFGRSLLLVLAACACAPFFASFYKNPELTTMLPVMFLSVLFQGALSVGAFVAVKKMEYSKWILIQQLGGAVGVLTSIVLAFYIRGVWALVIGAVTENLARCALSYIVAPFWPRWKFDREHLKSLMAFSRGMFGMPALLMVYTEGTTFAVGKMAPIAEVGVFAITLALARVPTFLSSMFADLSLPAFSEVQKDMKRINNGVAKLASVLSLINVPALMFVTLFAEQLLRILYGARYAAGAPLLPLLFANEIVFSFNTAMAAVFISMGRTSQMRKYAMIRAAVVLCLIYPAFQVGGLVGSACVPLAAALVSFGFQIASLGALTGLPAKAVLLAPLRGLLCSFPVILWWGISRFLPMEAMGWKSLVWAGVAVGGLYAVLGLIVYKTPGVRQWFWPETNVRKER
jgi:O-antigen/teichoic acid export membrane protein